MSNPPEKLWTEEEKYFLLTEILKKAGISSEYLFGIIKENAIQPRWMDIPLPQGRSLHSCQAAFYRMEAEYPHLQQRPNIPGPIIHQSTSPTSRKRPLAPPSTPASIVPRAIQPKPPNAIEHFTSSETRGTLPIARLARPASSEPPRKRGRPSKAELQRRAMAAGSTEQFNSPSRMSASTQRTPILHEASPARTSAGESPSLPGAPSMTQQMRADQPHQPQQIDTPTSQTQDIEVRRQSRPEVGTRHEQPVATSSFVGSNESTPRTVLNAQMPQSSAAVGPPSFRMINQSESDPPSHEATSKGPLPGPITDTASQTTPATQEGKATNREG